MEPQIYKGYFLQPADAYGNWVVYKRLKIVDYFRSIEEAKIWIDNKE